MVKRFCVRMFACAVLVFSLFLCSCEDSGDFYLGNGKDKDTVRDEIFNENEKDNNDSDDTSGIETPLPDNAPEKVYFTESGTVWHTRSDCSHIRNSASVIEGPLSEAFELGKTKQCSSCLSADEKDKNDSTEENGDDESGSTDESKNVFWLAGGSVWHKSEQCSYISADADLKSGSVGDAFDAGIEKPCSRCAKDIK